MIPVGQSIKAKYRGFTWYSAVVTYHNSDGTYDVRFTSDGMTEEYVRPEHVQLD
jgi:hypothetical protein